MDWLQTFLNNKELLSFITDFLDEYGIAGLRSALQDYSHMQKPYICKTKKKIDKIKINDIFYIEIINHIITVHTLTKTYFKYGTLKHELEYLQHFGFVKCNQSTLVPLSKIETIENNTIILKNSVALYLSRTCINRVKKLYFNHTEALEHKF